MCCKYGHNYTHERSRALVPCEICTFNQAYARAAARERREAPVCVVNEYTSTRNGVALPFRCPRGHLFMVTTQELVHASCTVCAIERRWMDDDVPISVIAGLYVSPMSLLRVRCADCVGEFYICPQDVPSWCTDGHCPGESRVFTAIRTSLETVFGLPFDDVADYMETVAYNRAARIMAVHAKLNPLAMIKRCMYFCRENRVALIHYTGYDEATIARETISCTIGALTKKKTEFSTPERNAQLGRDLLDLMARLRTGNRTLPAREHPRTTL
jgi:hypothetical protein